MKLEQLGELDWDKGSGLLPAVVQDVDTGAVLMLGFMNRQALRDTLTSRRVTFFSRSRQALWVKGETSGHFLEVASVSTDCDADTILVQAHPAGPVCHKGTPTCFPDSERTAAGRLAFLVRLEHIVAERIAQKPEGSYTAELFAQGPGRIAQKIGEEGVEVALAAVGQDDAKIVGESADLLYHLILLLRQRGLSLAEVAAELELRHAGRRVSGPAED